MQRPYLSSISHFGLEAEAIGDGSAQLAAEYTDPIVVYGGGRVVGMEWRGQLIVLLCTGIAEVIVC